MWHLAINALVGRPGRSLLLALAVALATALAVALSAGAGTMQASLRLHLGRIGGLADVHLRHRFGARLPAELLPQVRAWPQVRQAVGRFEFNAIAHHPRHGFSTGVIALGIDPAVDPEINPLHLADGRPVQGAGEVVIDGRVRKALEARVGDILELRPPPPAPGMFESLADVILGGLVSRRDRQRDRDLAVDRPPLRLTIVGVLERPALPILQRPLAVMDVADAWTVAGVSQRFDRLDLVLREGVEVDALKAAHADDLPPGVEPTVAAARSTGMRSQMAATRLIILIVTLLVFLSAGFLVMTGLSTSVNERLRELAILRCIGAGRGQLAAAQLLSGLLLCAAGAALGTPVGLGLAYLLYLRHRDTLIAGFQPDWVTTAAAVSIALIAGLLAALYPAVRAASVEPLEALAVRARKPRQRGLWLCLLLGLFFVALSPLSSLLPLSPNALFWSYVTVTLPLSFIGYFLLAVPALVALTHLLSRALAWVLAVPRELLHRSVLATPYRHGFTGGALMVGLAMLVSLWAGSRGVMDQWFNRLRMPDGFVCKPGFMGLIPATPRELADLRAVPGIQGVCATAAFPVRADKMQFGLRRLTPPFTLYVSFEPRPFFAMTDLEWIQGDPRQALERLERGGAVLVSREYLEAHGLGVGGTITLDTATQGPVDFEVAGVITSAGLELVVQRFGIQRYYGEASVSSVFGSRADAVRYWGNEQANLILLDFADEVDDRALIQRVRAAVPGSVAGSARQVRREAQAISTRVLGVASGLAIATLLIACFGVGNVIIANIAARRFEYGVLRSVGGQRWMVGRLILGETVLIALAGCVSGSALGLQLAAMGRVFHHRLMGLSYSPQVPLDIIALGGAIVVGLALAAAFPAVWRVVRMHPRTLLAAE